MKLRTLIKTATFAGLVGLAILNPEPMAKVIRSTFDVFRRAVTIT